VVALWAEAGAGALQLSFARRLLAAPPSEAEARSLTEQLLEDRGWRAEVRTITHPGGTAATSSITIGDEHWRVWHIVSRRRVAFLTYNSAAEDAGVEDAVLDEIVQSVRVVG
jgi:hypothetical protein